MADELQTERLVLRDLHPDDTDSFFAYRSHPEVSRYQSWEPQSPDETRAFIAALKTNPPFTGGTWHQFAIALRKDDTLIGDCGVRVVETDSRRAAVGITVAPDFQRQGYAAETLQGLLGMLFRTLKMRRIEAFVHPDNARSMALLERAGFVREADPTEDGDVGFALLDDEWNAANS